VTIDQGLEGWGEAFGFRAVRLAKLAVDELIPPLCVGQDAAQIGPLMLEVQVRVSVREARCGRWDPASSYPFPAEK
jgi:L-alanine-DL-glutamate epimerase-like enolase superfamily enzyme